MLIKCSLLREYETASFGSKQKSRIGVELVMGMFTFELLCFPPSRIHHHVDVVNVKDTATKFLKISLLVCKRHSMRCASEKST